MGLLNWRKPGSEDRGWLPSGSFTVDREGVLIASTISSRFPKETMQTIAAVVLRSFVEGRAAGVPLAEFTATFGAMNIRAVEMRGGAMIFLSPRREQQNRIQKPHERESR